MTDRGYVLSDDRVELRYHEGISTRLVCTVATEATDFEVDVLLQHLNESIPPLELPDDEGAGPRGRPCVVEGGGYWRGWCHGFTGNGKAMVESPSGTMSLVEAYTIRFTDRGSHG